MPSHVPRRIVDNLSGNEQQTTGVLDCKKKDEIKLENKYQLVTNLWQ
jgi:hypothetical protein